VNRLEALLARLTVKDREKLEDDISEEWKSENQKEFDEQFSLYRYYRLAEHLGLVQHEGPYRFGSIEDVVRAVGGDWRHIPQVDSFLKRTQSAAASKSGRKGGLRRRGIADDRHEEWVKAARLMLKRNPHRSAPDMARSIAEGPDETAHWDTIARVIRKALNKKRG